MSYDLEEINNNLILQWDGDDFYLLRYLPVRSANPATYLILDFKENKDDAVELIKNLLISVFEDNEQELRDTRCCRYILSIPSHKAGGTNIPGERVCKALAKRFDWLTHIPKGLVRTEEVPKSARSRSGERPTYDDHLKTIRYDGPQIKAGDTALILFDDVITLKATSSACRDILKQATGCKQVIGIFVGRTQWR